MKFALFTTVDFDRAVGETDEDIVRRCAALVQSVANALPKDVESTWMLKREPPADGVRLSILGTYWNGAGADNGRRRLKKELSPDNRQGANEPKFTLDRNIAIYGLDEAQEGIDPFKGSPHI